MSPMSIDLVNLVNRAQDARASVTRTLQGVNTGPTAGRRLNWRFRQVLRRSRETVTTIEFDEKGEHPRKVEHTFTRAGLAGYLTEQARELERKLQRREAQS